MSYNVPKKFSLKTIFNLIKRLYSSTFFDMLERLDLHFLYIENGEYKVIVAVESEKKSLNIFYGEDGFITFLSMVRDDARSFFSYASNYIVIEPRDKDEFPYENGDLVEKHFPLYHINGLPVAYLSYKKGRAEMPINDKESKMIIEILQYLLVIRDIYKTGKEKMPDEKNTIASFVFDDANYLYTLDYLHLESSDLMPNISMKVKKDQNFVLWLKEKQIMPGNLFLSLFVTNVKINQEIDKYGYKSYDTPSLLYACSDTKLIEHSLFTYEEKTFKKILKGEVLNIIDKIGLYDTVITDNYFVYLAIYKELEELGINVKFDLMNKVSNFIFKAIEPILFSFDLDIFLTYLKEFEADYPLVIDDIINDNSEMDNQDEELLEEEEEEKNVIS